MIRSNADPWQAGAAESASGGSTPWRKIFIIGPPASGKSFWARRVSDATGIATYELDPWFLRDEGDPERARGLGQLLAMDEWVMEGIYPWAEAMARADAVLVLSPPWWVRDYRIVWHRYLRPAVSKVAVTVWRMALTLKTSHTYGRDQRRRSESAAATLGLTLLTMPSGERLLAEVLAHRATTADTDPPGPARA